MPEESPIPAGPNVPLTIAQATALFKKQSENHTMPLRAVIEDLISSGAKTEFNNDSYVDALFLTSMMFDRSEKDVRLLSGPTCSMFLETLSNSFIRLLERLKKIGGSVRIIQLDAKTPSPFMEGLLNKYPDTFKIVHGKSTRPIKHFIVCDSKIARVEEVHDELEDSALATQVRAKVYFQDEGKAGAMESLFDSIWKKLVPLKK